MINQLSCLWLAIAHNRKKLISADQCRCEQKIQRWERRSPRRRFTRRKMTLITAPLLTWGKLFCKKKKRKKIEFFLQPPKWYSDCGSKTNTVCRCVCVQAAEWASCDYSVEYMGTAGCNSFYFPLAAVCHSTPLAQLVLRHVRHLHIKMLIIPLKEGRSRTTQQLRDKGEWEWHPGCEYVVICEQTRCSSQGGHRRDKLNLLLFTVQRQNNTAKCMRLTSL